MKKTFLILFSSAILFATAFHTIVIDGNNDFTSDETFSTSSIGYTAYFTWDANNLYFGYSGSDIGSGQSDKKWIVFYFDIDAHYSPTFGAGTLSAIGFNTQNWTLPFRADYMIQYRTDGVFLALKRFNGTNWVTVTPHNINVFDNNTSNYIEFSLPKASIGNPIKIYTIGYFLNETSMSEWTYASFPDNSLRDGDGYKSNGFFDNWYGFDLSNGISPNAPMNYNNKEFLKWDVRLGANISSLALSDSNNFAGMALNATNDYDPNIDLPKPPAPPSNFIYLSFPHPEWNQPLGPHFYRDIKAVQSLDTSTISWDFRISTDRNNENVTVFVSEFADLPSNYNIYIQDLTSNVLHNVRLNSHYIYNTANQSSRNFKLVIGKFVPNISTISTLNFGQVKIEYDSTRTFNVLNNGLDTLIISALNITGDFSVIGTNLPITIPAGGNSNLSVKFSPTSLGTQSGTLTIVSNDPDTPNYLIALSGEGIRPTVSTKFFRGWNLVGLPLYPANPKRDSVFGIFSSNYSLFGFSNGNYISVDSVFLGRGYWLGLQDTMNFSISGMPVTVDSNIALSNGWNLVSHIYLKDLLRQSLMVKRNNEIISLDSAVSRGWVQSNLFKYSNSTNSYFTIDTLDQFIGYWFAALTTNLELRFVKNSTIGNLPKVQNNFIDELNWKLNLSAMNSLSQDRLFNFGFNQLATSGFDNRFDNAKPPILPFDGAVEIYFRKTDWHPLFNKYFSDIRNYQSNQNYEWDFEFYSSRAENSQISWQNLSEIFPPNFLNSRYFILIDSTNNQSVNMKNQNSYQFTHNGNVTRFKLKFGLLTNNLDLTSSVLEFKLFENYPNPFNPTTKISWQSPIGSNDLSGNSVDNVKTTLTVYDVLGNHITTLVDDYLSAGSYEVEFKADNLPTGVYFYRLNVGNFSAVRKMLLVK